ncbi:MAG: glycoside hydrolase family 5 protein [Mobilitalea sp.]
MKNKITVFKRAIVILCLFCVILIGLGQYSTKAKAQENEGKQEKSQERFLKADGKVLKDYAGKGNIVTLHGTNIGGWQVMEAWMCPTNATDQVTAITTLTQRFGKEKAEELIKIYEKFWWQEQDFDQIKKLNFNVLRLPISYYNLLDEEGLLREDTLATYDWFVKECEERDIYVILDLHAAPGSQNGRDHSGDKSGSKLFTDETAQNLTVSLWEQLAKHYKGNPTIAGYDLLNEPEGTEQERWPWGGVQLPFYDRLYQAIRAIDPDHLIIFNAVWEPTNMPNPVEFGWENVMYEYHYYCWDGTDNAVAQRGFTSSKVANDNRAGHEVPVLIGEFTLFDKLQSWEHALNSYEENGWSWTTWTYKTVDQGNWGIFNSTSATTPKVNIYNDSAEIIADKWSKVGTEESFTKNKYLYDLLRVNADKAASSGDLRKWFQNITTDVELRAGTDAVAELVSGSETHSDNNDSTVICLTVDGAERMPTTTSRNVCISPTIRDSVDVTGMDYLIFKTYVRQGNRAINVTLVDKNGDTWSEFTEPEAMPLAYQWEKIFVDISKATIDLTAIIEVRIGANVSGSYYFEDIYFAESYTDPLPIETMEEMEKDLGVKGTITDWSEISEKSKEHKGSRDPKYFILTAIVVILLLSTGLIIYIKIRKTKKIK